MRETPTERFRVVLWHDVQKRVVFEPSKEYSQSQMDNANQHFARGGYSHMFYVKKDEVPK